MRLRVLAVVCAWIVVETAATRALGQSAPRGGDDKDTLGRAVITAYAANINSFPYYKCKYRYTKAEAKTVDDAIRGKWVNARFFDNRLIIDGEKELYEGFAPPPDLKNSRPAPGRKGGFIVASPGNSNKYLGDGKREMNYSPPLASANLFSTDRRRHGPGPDPLAMEFVGHRNSGGPDVLLREPARYQFTVDGVQNVRGRELVTVRFKDSQIFHGGKLTIEFGRVFSFDRDRGCLPVQMMRLWNGKPKSQMFVTDVRECSNGRWFPERTVAVHTPDNPNALCDVDEIKVLELDVDKRPDAGEFVHVIPAGTSVSDSENPGRFFRLQQEEKISVEQLPKLFKMLDQVVVNPRMPTAVNTPSSLPWIKGLSGTVGVMAAVWGVFFLVRRRRRSASA
jgi:hypothetical protein